MTDTDKFDILEMTPLVADIVAAYVSNHTVISEDLPSLISLVHKSLAQASQSNSRLSSPSDPAVPLEDSIHPDFIVCLEDGKRFKMIKRHLKTVYNMTPDQYRKRWDLPDNYPMVAPNYANIRRKIAKGTGLGKLHKNKKKKAA